MSELTSLLSSQRCLRLQADHPEQLLDTAVSALISAGHAEQLLAVDFNLREYWRAESAPLALVALYHLQKNSDDVSVTATVMRAAELSAARWRELQRDSLDFSAWLHALQIPAFRLDQALLLQPISIAKPWGREIWYTGIEQRGVAEISDGRFAVALPWLLAIAPRRLLGGEQEPILLKILDPLPEAVFGDLYFEMHRQKQEVYVVTAVDANAWPDGKGAIRFGFDAELRAEYDDDKKFLGDYLASVRAYREIRSSIDRQLDVRREAESIGLNEPLSASTLQAWLAELPSALGRQEQATRAAMESFTGVQALQVGDVIKVPCLVPHSLQHGVRTVEFQTPVYERLILSFAQKVLTQTDWDTETAAAELCMDPPPVDPWSVTAQGDGWVEERIVEFDNFEVRRITLQRGVSRILDSGERYGLLMAVGPDLHLQGDRLPADTAVLLPAVWSGGEVANLGSNPAYLLLATPTDARG